MCCCVLLSAAVCSFSSEDFLLLHPCSQRQNDKQSYAIETRFPDKDASGSYDGDRFPLLGLPSEKDWALYGPEADPTMGMRNWMAFWAARQMGRWAPRTQYVELFLIRDEAGLEGLDIRKHYEGIYLLMETVERVSRRIGLLKNRSGRVSKGRVCWTAMEGSVPRHVTMRCSVYDSCRHEILNEQCA